MDNVSPLAPSRFADLPALKGVGLAVAEAGIKYTGRKDVLLMHFDEGAAVAGVFTTSKCASAPVDWCKHCLLYTSPSPRDLSTSRMPSSA